MVGNDVNSSTPSRRACPCFYLYRRSTLPLFDQFLKDTQDKPLKDRDAPGNKPLNIVSIASYCVCDGHVAGNFLTWLWSRSPVYAYAISGRFDIGGLDSYIECDDFFKKKAATTTTATSTPSSSSSQSSSVGAPSSSIVVAKT
jgi:hypothetical protein